MKDWMPKRLVQPEYVLVRELEGESVLLNLRNETYYSLDDVGTRIWQVVVAEESINAAFDVLLAGYDITPEVLQRDMEALLGQLLEQGLLKVSDDPA